jgi:hypothetical protein
MISADLRIFRLIGVEIMDSSADLGIFPSEHMCSISECFGEHNWVLCENVSAKIKQGRGIDRDLKKATVSEYQQDSLMCTSMRATST